MSLTAIGANKKKLMGPGQGQSINPGIVQLPRSSRVEEEKRKLNSETDREKEKEIKIPETNQKFSNRLSFSNLFSRSSSVEAEKEKPVSLDSRRSSSFLTKIPFPETIQSKGCCGCFVILLLLLPILYSRLSGYVGTQQSVPFFPTDNNNPGQWRDQPDYNFPCQVQCSPECSVDSHTCSCVCPSYYPPYEDSHRGYQQQQSEIYYDPHLQAPVQDLKFNKIYGNFSGFASMILMPIFLIVLVLFGCWSFRLCCGNWDNCDRGRRSRRRR